MVTVTIPEDALGKDAITIRITKGEPIRPMENGGARDKARISEEQMRRVVEYFLLEMDQGGKDYYLASDVARLLDINPAQAGILIQRIFPVSPVRNKGYPAWALFEYLQQLEAESGCENEHA